MLKQQLANIKQFILDNNSYFNNGYDDVYQNEKGMIGNNNELIFPADNRGNYFYLRLPKNIGFKYDEKYRTNDCIAPLIITSQIILVAQVKGADPDILLNNLLNTVLNIGHAFVITGAIMKAEEVILQELAKIDPINIDAALKNLDVNNTLVSISFNYSTQFVTQKLSCITNPCKTC